MLGGNRLRAASLLVLLSVTAKGFGRRVLCLSSSLCHPCPPLSVTAKRARCYGRTAAELVVATVVDREEWVQAGGVSGTQLCDMICIMGRAAWGMRGQCGS
jgi:hypothetical protein